MDQPDTYRLPYCPATCPAIGPCHIGWCPRGTGGKYGCLCVCLCVLVDMTEADDEALKQLIKPAEARGGVKISPSHCKIMLKKWAILHGVIRIYTLYFCCWRWPMKVRPLEDWRLNKHFFSKRGVLMSNRQYKISSKFALQVVISSRLTENVQSKE